MAILIVGNIIKDIYLNLDTRTEKLETDKHNIDWLNLSFDASEHRFFNRSSNLGGATISLEVLTKLNLTATINNSTIKPTNDGFTSSTPIDIYRYIVLANDKPSYFVPTKHKITTFTPPAEAYDYLYIDRSTELDQTTANRIASYLDISAKTKLILYIRNFNNQSLNMLIPRADLIFLENPSSSNHDQTLLTNTIDPSKIVTITEHHLVSQNISEPVSINRIDKLTHLSAYSIASATILGSFILGHSIEDSLRFARINVENSKLNSSLTIEQIQSIDDDQVSNNLELIARNLVLYPKGILAADESGGSIHKKFDQLQIADIYDNRRNYRNIFFTTPNLAKYVNGIILFDETARQLADDGQNYVDYITSQRIIPGIKADQGLEPLSPNSLETITKGLNGLDQRLAEYYQMGLRFAKWRAAFELRINQNNDILTPTKEAIVKNCDRLTKYALICQQNNIVPIVEPEVVYDGYYNIKQSAEVTGKILRALFSALNEQNVNLKACILKVNMVLAGKQYDTQSTPSEVGEATAEVLKANVPSDLAGVVFLSGGQTVEQATDNLAAIIHHGPFPWPVTFSFARALQDPALYAWRGDNANADSAREAFLARLIANTEALKKTKD